jgi:tetratricopeptide (TPR) repeat protein
MKMSIKSIAANAFSKTVLAAALVTAPALSSLAVNSIAPEQSWLVAGSVQAQELIRAAGPDPSAQPRRIPALTDTTFRRFAEVQELIQPEEGSGQEPDLNRALQVLRQIERDRDRLNAYEVATLYNYTAFIHYTQENFAEAIKAYEQVVSQSPMIPLSQEAQTIFTIGQLQMAQEQYREAMQTFRRWARVTPSPINADQYALFAQLFYHLDDSPNALLHINEAVRMHEVAGRVPAENWYGLQRALYFEREDYKNVAVVMQKLVRHYPRHSYWRQLSAIYGLLGREDDRLHALEATYVMGGLDAERDLLNLAYFFLEKDVPYKAAKILDKGINQDKIIEPTARNLELLANSWRMAQEISKSLVEMEKAAQKSEDGELLARLASFYSLNDRFEDSIKAGEQALKRGGVRRPDQLHILIGTANSSLGNHEKALEAFREAAKDKRSQATARQWIDYVEGEMRRERQLRRGAG